MKRLPVVLECPDDAMDYPTFVLPGLHFIDQLIGHIASLEQQTHRLHELIPDWLRTIRDLRRENQDATTVLGVLSTMRCRPPG